MGRIIKALDQLHDDLPGYRVVTCLETTVGSGTNLGYDFHHLAYLRAGLKRPERVECCFDTCHVTAAGYDMTTDAAARGVMEQWDSICGDAHLRVFHFNDSVGAVGSRKDRHAHVGDGTCGEACFRTILNHPSFRAVPKILETPKEDTEKGTPWDVVNIRRLKRLAKPRPTDR
jgi:deoxyribonuclease-4